MSISGPRSGPGSGFPRRPWAGHSAHRTRRCRAFLGCGAWFPTPRLGHCLPGCDRRRPREAVPGRARGEVGARWQEEGTYAFDRSKERSEYTRSTPRRRPYRASCTWGTSSRTRTPTRSPGSSGCAARRSSTRWAGTTTACRPSAGCRTSTACGATRRCRTTPRSCRRLRCRRTQGRIRPISRRNFVELCAQLTVEDEQAFEALWRRLGLSRRLGADVHDDRGTAQRDLAARVPAQPRPR